MTPETVHVNRDIWYATFEVEHHEIDGQDWPLVIVNKWETNTLGERRFVASTSISPEDLRKHASTA